MSSFSFAVLWITVSTRDTGYTPWERKEHSQVTKRKKRGIFNRSSFDESFSQTLEVCTSALKSIKGKYLLRFAPPFAADLNCLNVNCAPQHTIAYVIFMPTMVRNQHFRSLGLNKPRLHYANCIVILREPIASRKIIDNNIRCLALASPPTEWKACISQKTISIIWTVEILPVFQGSTAKKPGFSLHCIYPHREMKSSPSSQHGDHFC